MMIALTFLLMDLLYQTRVYSEIKNKSDLSGATKERSHIVSCYLKLCRSN
jgi:hypothetical protein